MLLQGRQETMGRGCHSVCPDIAKPHKSAMGFLVGKTGRDSV